MNYDLDLRSPAGKEAARSFSRSAARVFFTLCLLLIPPAFFCGLGQYAAWLDLETEALRSEISALSAGAEPLITMTAEAGKIRARIELEKALDRSGMPWPHYLQKISSAAPPALTLDSIEITPERGVEIKGSGSEMQLPALYQQNLERLDFTGYTELKSIALNPQGSYSFQMQTDLISRDGVEEDE